MTGSGDYGTAATATVAAPVTLVLLRRAKPQLRGWSPSRLTIN